MAECELPEVAQQDRHPVALRHHDGSKVAQRAHKADAADNIALIAARDSAAARVRTVVVDRRDHVVEANAEILELDRIELELILQGKTAEVGDVGYSGQLFERRDHGPSLDFRKFHQVLRIGFQSIAVDFTDRTGHRVEARLDARRQSDIVDSIRDALT